MRTIEQMVQQEILCCMSSIVSTLAGGAGGQQLGGDSRGNGRLRDLEAFCEQAFELAAPVPDYEEAANQHPMAKTGDPMRGRDAEAFCALHDVEPYDWEVYEHWAVTDRFADRLIEQGEKVDKDFGALCIWARTTTGQSISMDGVVQRIYEKMMQPVEA